MTDKKDFADSIRQKLEDWDYQLDRLTARLGDKRDEWRADKKNLRPRSGVWTLVRLLAEPGAVVSYRNQGL